MLVKFGNPLRPPNEIRYINKRIFYLNTTFTDEDETAQRTAILR